MFNIDISINIDLTKSNQWFYLVAGILTHHQWKDSLMKLQGSITWVVTTVHEDVVFTVVAMKVTVKNYVRLSHQPGENTE